MRPHFRAVLFSAAVLSLAAPALAGPPLLCHPYQIGSASSLPWNPSNGWTGWMPEYKIENLVADTEALLTPSTPVIVRMETLRRASLYATADRAIASQLLNRLVSRATAAEKKGRPDALALLDAAYVAGAFREIAMLSDNRSFHERAVAARAALGDLDGYALIVRSIAARPDDPAIQFAAALIAADKDRSAYLAHAQKAREGAARDPLLARNIGMVS